MTTVLLTGATGFIGREIARRLVGAGHRVIALARSRGGVPAAERVTAGLGALPRRARLTVLEHEMGAPFADADRAWLADTVDTVIHAAGDTHFFPRDEHEFRAGHVDGPLALLDALAGGRVRRFAHVSTAFVCGARSGLVLEREGDVGQRFHNPYERVKLDAELALGAAAAARGVDLRIVRPGIVVGDAPVTSGGAPSNLFFDAVRLMAAGVALAGADGLRGLRIAGAPDAAFNIVPVDYVAAGTIALALAAGAGGGTYHLVTSAPPRQRQTLDWVAGAIGLHGARVVPAVELSDADASPVERRLAQMLGAYREYLTQDVRFDDRCARRVLDGAGVPPATLDETAIVGLVRRAVVVDRVAG